MSVLVTGGAGYIGSHVARMLAIRGEHVVVLEDFTSGLRTRVREHSVESQDLAASNATQALLGIFARHNVTSVVHLAARKQVGQSVEKPEWYYQQNVGGLVNLLTAMREANVDRLVFSSSAATYGMPDVDLVTEDIDCHPINPYGETKLIGEWMVANASQAWNLRAASLRYFNVAGTGWPEFADSVVTNLVPIVFDAIRKSKKPVVFGTDYPTPDGTCIRDYIHVHDIADAHLKALDYLEKEDRPHSIFNVGTGKGSSVFEVFTEIRKVTGIDFEAEIADRRAGDPPRLAADVSRIEETLGWKATHGLTEIIQSAWDAIQQR
jgi:UDP-glucose 4-epimerase